MLLETLDIKQNDVVIYSQNLFSNEKNFKIVFKDGKDRTPRDISYEDVCGYINEYTPKNLIVYRLLTNITGFEFYNTKYAFHININGSKELIFFDPVYAVRELEEYPNEIDYGQLRFRIQQVGLTTLNRKAGLPNYAEIYSIDLEATEAKFQNDKVFADAIISTLKAPPEPAALEEKSAGHKHDEQKKSEAVKKVLDINLLKQSRKSSEAGQESKPLKTSSTGEKRFDKLWKNEIPEKPERHSKVTIAEEILPDSVNNLPEANEHVNNKAGEENNKGRFNHTGAKHIDGIKIIQHDISEDKNFDIKELMKARANVKSQFDDKKLNARHEQVKPAEPVSKQPKLPAKKQEPKKPGLLGSYLKTKETAEDINSKKANNAQSDENVSTVLNMFKSSTAANEYLQVRSKKHIILKLDNK